MHSPSQPDDGNDNGKSAECMREFFVDRVLECDRCAHHEKNGSAYTSTVDEAEIMRLEDDLQALDHELLRVLLAQSGEWIENEMQAIRNERLSLDDVTLRAFLMTTAMAVRIVIHDVLTAVEHEENADGDVKDETRNTAIVEDVPDDVTPWETNDEEADDVGESWESPLAALPWHDSADDDEVLTAEFSPLEDIDASIVESIVEDAANVAVDLARAIRNYREIVAKSKEYASEDHPIDSADFSQSIIDMMERVARRNDGIAHVQSIVSELYQPEVFEVIDWFSDMEQIGCIKAICHIVAEAALSHVDAFKSLVDAGDDGDYDGTERNCAMALAFITRLLKRYCD
jgi:hypothetical protein